MNRLGEPGHRALIALALVLTPSLAQADHYGPAPSIFAPRIWGGVDYLHMWRNDGRNVATTRLDTTNAVVLSSNDADFSGRSGFRAFGGLAWDQSAVELVYVKLATARASASAVDAGENLQPILPTPFAATDIDSFEDAFRHTVVRKADLHSFEANYKHQVGTFWGVHTIVLAGFRHARVRDTLLFEALDEANDLDDVGAYNIRAKNHLYGGQIGAKLHRSLEFLPGLGVGLNVKVGFFANRAQVSHFLINEQVTQFDGTNRKTSFSTMIDGGLLFTYEPMRNIVFQAGYNVIYITGLALAPNNYASYFGANTGGSVLYHGPVVGLKVRFGN